MDGIEKFLPWDYHNSSFGKPPDANGDSWDGFFYPTLTFMLDSYNPAGKVTPNNFLDSHPHPPL